MLHHLPIAVPIGVMAMMVTVLALQVRRIGRLLPPFLPLPWSGEERRSRPASLTIKADEPQCRVIAMPLDARQTAIDHGRFLTQLSHELHAPLNAVMGFAERLLASSLPPAQRRQIELIRENSRTMQRLLGDVLDVGRMEAGELRIVREPADLRHVLDQCAALLRPNAEARGLVLAVHVDDAVPQRVPLDTLRLRQVLLNLLGNAVKFTGSGTVKLEARMMPLVDGRPGIGISVIDTGTGIGPDRLEAIFRPFCQMADSDDLRPIGGTGLGLAISRRIVAAMDGELAVTSAVGLGSCFTVHLPLADLAAPHLPAPPVPMAAPYGASLRGCRVLVAEDHEINQELLLSMLDTLGLVATVVTNGHDAVEAVEQARRNGEPFHLVLMDVHMPGMDGLDATMHLRTAGYSAASLPIIALTADCRPQDIESCLAAGMQAHLAKPVRMAELGRALRAAMGMGSNPASAAPTPGKDVQAVSSGNPAVVQRLERRYRDRKAVLFNRLRTALASAPDTCDDGEWREIGMQLHKLAGVAANFGEEGLGDLARQLEQDLKAAHEPADRHGLLGRSWPAMARFV